VCSSETEEDFEFIFRTLKNHTPHLTPKVLIAEGADAITNGLRKVFEGNFARVICNFHVKKNLKEFLRSDILHDISFLELASSEYEFNLALGFFLKKWKEH